MIQASSKARSIAYIREALPAGSVILAAALLTLSSLPVGQLCWSPSPIKVTYASPLPSEAIAPAPLQSDMTENAAGRAHTIVMSNIAPFYTPASLTIELGEAVRWVNAEHSDTHSIHARSGHLDSPDVTAGSQWCFRFDREGEYNYTCRFHPWMQGTILVKARNVDASHVTLSPEISSSACNLESAGAGIWLIAHKESPLLVQVSAEGVVARYRLPARLRSEAGFCFARNNRFLFINEASGKICEVDLSRRAMRTRALAPAGSTLRLLAASKPGDLWLFDAATNSFMSLASPSERLTKFVGLRIRSAPIKALVDPTGKLWFIEESRNCAGFFDPSSGQLKEYQLPVAAYLVALDVTSAGQAWLADAGRNKIIKINDGWITEYTVPTAHSSPQGLAVDEQGNVWFTESLANRIARLKDGHFDEYRLPVSMNRPMALGKDAQGNLWFTLQTPDGLGRIAARTTEVLISTDQDQNETPCSATIDRVGSQAHLHNPN